MFLECLSAVSNMMKMYFFKTKFVITKLTYLNNQTSVVGGRRAWGPLRSRILRTEQMICAGLQTVMRTCSFLREGETSQPADTGGAEQIHLVLPSWVHQHPSARKKSHLKTAGLQLQSLIVKRSQEIVMAQVRKAWPWWCHLKGAKILVWLVLHVYISSLGCCRPAVLCTGSPAWPASNPRLQFLWRPLEDCGKIKVLTGPFFRRRTMLWRNISVRFFNVNQGLVLCCSQHARRWDHVQPPECIFPSYCCVYGRWESHSQENKRQKESRRCHPRSSAVTLWSTRYFHYWTGASWPTTDNNTHRQWTHEQRQVQNNRHKYSSLWEKEYKRRVHPCAAELHPAPRFLFSEPPPLQRGECWESLSPPTTPHLRKPLQTHMTHFIYVTSAYCFFAETSLLV